MKRLGLTLLFAVAACRSSSASTAAPEPPPARPAASAASIAPPPQEIHVERALLEEGRIVVSVATLASADVHVALPGEVVPAANGEADVSVAVSGRVVDLTVGVGDRVTLGQALGAVSSAELGRASADKLRAEAHVEVAQRKLDRQTQLEKDQATSAASVDDARAELRIAQADRLAATTLLASMGAPAGGDRLILRAPIAGVVVRRDVVLGAPVRPESPLLHIVAPDRLIVRAKLPETNALSIGVGAAAMITPRARRDDRPGCAAHVTSRFAIVDESTRAIPILVTPDAPCAALSPGAYVDVTVRASGERTSLKEASGLAVPSDAIVDVRGASVVFIAGKDETTFSPRRVRTGSAEAGMTHVESGLEAGERVVVRGALLLKGELMRADLGGD
jgi:cobalt-zinc-cadmium efflux system membrane fusion protein